MSTSTAPAPARPQGTPGQPRPRARRHAVALAASLVLLAIATVAGIAIGARAVSPSDVWAVLTGASPHDPQAAVVVALRLPRVAIGLVAGVCLGVSGALVQAVTRNPLADPGILGTTSGAAFALALGAGLAGIGSQLALLALAFAGAAVATVAVYAIGALGPDGGSPVRLVLTGTALGAVLTGITQAILLSDPERFQVMQTWRAGSLADRGWAGLAPALPFVLAGLLLAALIATSLNAIALGDDLAASLGANVALVRTAAVVAVTLLAGAATALAGPIAFVGLMVPHVARALAGPDQRWILVHCVVLGPTLLLAADVLGRVVMPPGELPAGIVTAFVGAPVLIWLVRRGRVGEL